MELFTNVRGPNVLESAKAFQFFIPIIPMRFSLILHSAPKIKAQLLSKTLTVFHLRSCLLSIPISAFSVPLNFSEICRHHKSFDLAVIRPLVQSILLHQLVNFYCPLKQIGSTSLLFGLQSCLLCSSLCFLYFSLGSGLGMRAISLFLSRFWTW